MRTAALVAASLAALAPLAAADPAADVAQADALFAEAQKLLEAGDLKGACGKFEQSLKLNGQAIGTLLNVARCDARLGKFAHAVALYTEARDRGREQNLPAYVATAEQQIADLSASVPHVALHLAETLPGTAILIDGVAQPVGTTTDLALDPGAHALSVTAPDRVPFESKIELAAAEHKTVDVPALAKPTTNVTVVHKGRHLAGLILAGGGGALAGTGVVFGLVARSRYHHALDTECTNGDALHCSPMGGADTRSARELGTAGTIIGVAGLAAAAAGAIILVTMRSDRETHAVTVAPVLAPDAAGIVAVGHF